MGVTLYHAARIGLARDSLTGLSVGDALGEQYFQVGRRAADLVAGRVPPPVWNWTDDTEMACSVVANLDRCAGIDPDAGIHPDAGIDPDALAASFVEHCHPWRGYGVGAYTVLQRIGSGTSWSAAAAGAFGGQGSCGNGAAMRVAPVGAYFADNRPRAAEHAARSARVTHQHPEGVAGAVAVALAASLAAGSRLSGQRPRAGAFIEAVRRSTPPGTVRQRLRRAGRMVRAPVDEAAGELGNGAGIIAQDTVPFAVWVAATRLADYPAAITACVSAGGDMDTTSAIVGGIVAAYTGRAGIPPSWLRSREPLPDFAGVGDESGA